MRKLAADAACAPRGEQAKMNLPCSIRKGSKMRLFNYDGGVMRSISKFTDCIGLSLLFLISCIPIFTAGTAMAAMYHTAYKVLHHDRGYVFRDYIEAFRDNFKQTAPVWLLALLLGSLLGVDGYIMNFYAKGGNIPAAFGGVFLVGMIVWFVWISYLFPYMARFENTRKQSMKNAILFPVIHFPMTVLNVALAAGMGALFYIFPFLIVILPAIYSWIQSYILEWVFRKYMTEEERAAEDERNSRGC